MSERNRLEKISASVSYDQGIMHRVTQYSGAVLRRHMVDGGVLELGPAEGVMTDILFPEYPDYTVVDGAKIFVDELLKRHDSIKGIVSLFEDYKPKRKYENIILGHVLEHVAYPVEILRLVASWLVPDGVIIAAVPNCNSLHRQAAVKMGLLKTTNELNSQDIANGHRRVYSLDELIQDFEDAGLVVAKSGGYFLKPVSNGQIDRDWNEGMLDAFLRLGEDYPDIAGEIYVVAKVSDNSKGEAVCR